MTRLFHVAPESPWRARLALPRAARGPYAPPSLGAEGFVHLSFAHQVQGTLETHFTESAGVFLIEVDAGRLGAGLRLEVARGGAPFPHLYRALETRDLLRAWPLARGTRWSVPHLAATDAALDDPAGRSDLV